MAALDKDQLKNLCKLARIGLSDQEESSLLENLSQVLEYVDQLQEVDTEGVRPCHNVLSVSNVLRDDEVGELLEREVFLGNSPDHVGGMVRVPTILKGA